MNRIPDAFKHKKAFIAFLTAGDPDIQTTEKLVLGMAKDGADLIELGIPFSDPVAEGEVIQRAGRTRAQGGHHGGRCVCAGAKSGARRRTYRWCS